MDNEQQGIQEFDFTNERVLYKSVLFSITSHRLMGIELVLGKIFDKIGFNQIKDELLKRLVSFWMLICGSQENYLY
jgi:hypothetical protein